ncbi:nitrilase-related carbon-nitrogen hydrolase [Ktedonosporobacter rubrisoli]|nr:nitrilase-related carbon-nitrogen hydrolase [Ktedonosporobacter rubrisoli]
MQKKFHAYQVEPDKRLGYLWLILGTLLSLFAANGRWDIPLAAWLYPLFFLRFMRTSNIVVGLLGLWLASAGATLFFLYESQILTPFIFISAQILGTMLLLPFLLDRLLAPRLGAGSGLLATLIFPLSRVACEYLTTLVPYGTGGGLLGYTQQGNLPLIQIVAITGVYGVSFLIAWFASVGNWIWEQHFAWPRIRLTTLLYSGVLALTLLGGGCRLAFFPPSASTIRVAGISAAPAASHKALEALRNFPTSEQLAHANPAQLRPEFAALNEELLKRSLQEAQAGAKIVVWPEGGAMTLAEDETALIEGGKNLTRKTGIYLEMGLIVFLHQAPYAENKTILLDPQGRVLWTYHKVHPFGTETYTPGNPIVPVVDTLYGRLANVICFDADDPDLMRQGGRKGADIMLVPSNDWQGIDPWHTQNATFRAIEDGYSVVRQTSNGLAMSVDYQGHVLAATDYFTTDAQTMIAYVPREGALTIYPFIGDLFVWLCIAGLFLLGGYVLYSSWQKRWRAAK